MPTKPRPTWAGFTALRPFILAAITVAAATGLRFALTPLLGKRGVFLVYFPALVLSAWGGDWVGGLTALVLSVLAGTYFFLDPTHRFAITGHTDQFDLLIFAAVGLSVCAMSSSQHRARRQAEQSAAALRESEVFLRASEASRGGSEARKSAVLEVALDCIITMDDAGAIIEFNPAAERTFGYTRADVLGRRVADVIIPPALRDAHSRGLLHFLATGEGPVLHRRIELTAIRQGGAEFPVEVAIMPTTGPQGVEFTAYLRDITDRRAQEQERDRLLQEVRAGTHLQRVFLRDVLASVTEGHLILCDTEADLPVPLMPQGQPIALSHTDGGLPALRRLALDAAAGMAEECRHDLVTAVSEAGMNAITHGGGGTGQVSVGSDGTVQVRVEDQGGGITLAALPKATLARGYSTKATLGHGMKMMQQVDRVYVLTGPAGTTVVLEQGRIAAVPSWLLAAESR